MPRNNGAKVASKPLAMIITRLAARPPEPPMSQSIGLSGSLLPAFRKRLRWLVNPTVMTTKRINNALKTRLTVPPKPAAIFAGEDSRKSGIHAPIPTAIPERPPHRAIQQARCT